MSGACTWINDENNTANLYIQATFTANAVPASADDGVAPELDIIVTATRVPMPADGILFLAVNDDERSDNAGEFIVSLRSLRR